MYVDTKKHISNHEKDIIDFARIAELAIPLVNELNITLTIPYHEVLPMTEREWQDDYFYDMYEGPIQGVLWTKSIRESIINDNVEIVISINIIIRSKVKMIQNDNSNKN